MPAILPAIGQARRPPGTARSARRDFPAGQDPHGLAVGDLNRDGTPDVAVCVSYGSDDPRAVLVLPGDGHGGLGAGLVNYSVYPFVSLAIGDLNRDGNPDLVATSGMGTVVTMTGYGDGTFPTVYPPYVTEYPMGNTGRFGPVSAQAVVPARVSLQIAPNPGTGVMNVTLALPAGGDVSLRLVDPQGREVARHSWLGLKAGIRRERWEVRDVDGRQLRSGVYFARMDAPTAHRTVRWLVIR